MKKFFTILAGMFLGLFFLLTSTFLQSCARSCEDYEVLSGSVDADEGYSDFSKAYCEKRDKEYDTYKVSNSTLIISCCEKGLF